MMKVQNRRIVPLLKIFHEKSDSVTSRYLAQMLGVSTRTVRSDVKELGELLGRAGARIEAKPNRGYRLLIDDAREYEAFRRTLMDDYAGAHIVPQENSDRVSFIIAHILLNSLHKKVVLQEALADELFISLSTLKKYLSEIKRSLARFELTLDADRSHGVRIVGDEAKIRYCISEYVFNRSDMIDLAKNPFFQTIFPKEEIEFLKEILLKVILKHNIHLTDVAFKNLLIHIIITLRRKGGENTVLYSRDEMKTLRASAYFEVTKDLLTSIKNQLGVNIENEGYYITQHFIASQKYSESGHVLHECRPLVDEMLDKIRTDTGIDLSGDEELILGLTVHLLAAINRLKFNMNIRNEILEAVKRSFPLAFDMALIAGEVIEREENVRSNENEMGFLAIHFGASLERNRYNAALGKTAMIVCGAGLSTAMMLQARLQRKFGALLQIKKVLSYRDLRQSDMDEVDLIFSTVPIPGMRSDKVIEVMPILTEQDLKDIECRLQAEPVKRRDYRQIFKEDLFFPWLAADSAEEAIEKMTGEMVRCGYIDAKTRASVFEREKLSPTELSGMIAVPHAVENFMQHPAVGVAILKEPILWSRMQVQLVFLLSIPRAFYKMLEPVIQSIYYHFVTRDGFQRMEKTRTFSELLAILAEENRMEEYEAFSG